MLHSRPLEMMSVSVDGAVSKCQVFSQAHSRLFGDQCWPILGRSSNLMEKFRMPTPSFRYGAVDTSRNAFEDPLKACVEGDQYLRQCSTPLKGWLFPWSYLEHLSGLLKKGVEFLQFTFDESLETVIQHE